LELGEARCFISRNTTFNEFQMTMRCRDPKKGKEKFHVEVEPSNDGSDYLKVSNNVN